MVRILDTLPTNTSDTLDLSLFGEGADTILGLTNSDFLTSDTVGGSLIFGNTENDSIVSRGAGDTIYGGQDDDFLVSQAGGSLFFGDLGQDRFETRGSAGRDTVYGGTNNQSENREGDTDDILNFGNGLGSNLAFGNGGDDFISGSGFGTDSLYGGVGDDTIQVIELAGGGSGGGVGGGAFVPDATQGLIQLTPIGLGIGGTGGGIGGLDVGVVDETGVLPPNNPGRNYLSGDIGNDVIFGVGDRDSLFGGAGSDSLYMLGANANEFIDIVDEDGDNTDGTQRPLRGFPRNNLLDGGDGNDSMWSFGGQRGRQTLRGGEGDDTLQNRGSQTILFGNTGQDYLETGGSFDRSTLYGGQGDDSVVSGLDSGIGTNLLFGDKGNDTLLSNGARDTLVGGTQGQDDQDTLANNNNDYLSFSGVTSVGFGNKGDDTLIGGGDSSTLYGGQDNDRLTAAGANSYLSGDKGNDFLGSSGTGSTLWGAEGVDTLLTVASNSTLVGGEGNDSLYARNGGGNNLLMAVSGDNVLVAGKASDTLMGGTGNDFITGSAENDTLSGISAGNDTLEGFLGADILQGTVGAFDGFLYQTPSSAEGNDTITTFESGRDKFYFKVRGGGFPLDQEAISGLRTNIDFFSLGAGATEIYTGTFQTIGNATPAIVFDAQDQGGFLLYDPTGGAANAAGDPNQAITTIAVIQSGQVRRDDIILF